VGGIEYVQLVDKKLVGIGEHRQLFHGDAQAEGVQPDLVGRGYENRRQHLLLAVHDADHLSIVALRVRKGF
jgi:hypothetical protein